MPPDHIVEAFTNMRKNLMHGDSKLIFNYSVLDFENFLYDDEVPLNEILLRVERGTIGPSGGLLFTLLKEYQEKICSLLQKHSFSIRGHIWSLWLLRLAYVLKIFRSHIFGGMQAAPIIPE